jgi:hypothetical protein
MTTYVQKIVNILKSGNFRDGYSVGCLTKETADQIIMEAQKLKLHTEYKLRKYDLGHMVYISR